MESLFNVLHTVGGPVLRWLSEWWKPIMFQSKCVLLYFRECDLLHGDTLPCDSPSQATEAEVLISLTFFNKKSHTVGLHEMAVEFKDGSKAKSRTLCSENIYRGNEKSGELDLPCYDTIRLQAKAYIRSKDKFDCLRNSHSVWLTCRTTEGRNSHRTWLLAELREGQVVER